ncbi:hypothetical protein P171DRAFT_430281 [Karstenula rhodostoma CBS 690.94]|uniref:Uncharacterized protein n=1 Tax=Karstenula rhodostoma CBS 690.94 TaxID=1392251 RepID=A0A9P4PKU8_9PLEO|nr:hypothetical protein P171DRAFT_430281 [Karstenula rhodostoma CBS 690.94]
MGLFQWWLYAQPSRSVASDPPIPGKLNANDAFSILRSRNAKYIAQNQARHHRYEAVLKGEVNHLTYSEVLAYGRRNIPPLWFPQDGKSHNDSSSIRRC